MGSAAWVVPPCIEKVVAFKAIQAYAAFSYAYYEKDVSLIDDQEFDALCRWLHNNFNWLKPHDINNYLDEDSLLAGTGYNVNVIGQTRDHAEALIKQHAASLEDLV